MNFPVELCVANGVEELAILRAGPHAKLLKIIASDDRRRIEFTRRESELLAAEVDLGCRTIDDAGDGFAVAEQFVSPRSDEDALQLGPGLPAGAADDRLFGEALFDAGEFIGRELPALEDGLRQT